MITTITMMMMMMAVAWATQKHVAALTAARFGDWTSRSHREQGHRNAVTRCQASRGRRLDELITQ